MVAIDGKTVRRSGSRRHDQGPLHLVSAWASDQGLVLGQREVDGKSNEITAIPELLDTLHLEDSIVTLDAMGCQKDIAARIRAKGADYLLGLKANHGRAFEAVQEHFERTCFSRGASGRPVFDAFDDSHGRLVRRRVFVCPVAAELEPLHDWPDLRTVLAVETIRGVNGTGKVEAEIRYFLPAAAMILPSWSRRSAGTGRSRRSRHGASQDIEGGTVGCWSDNGHHGGGPWLASRAAMVAASACTSLRGREAAAIERLRRRPLRTQP